MARKCQIEMTVGCFSCPYPDCTFDERNDARKEAQGKGEGNYYLRHREERLAYQKQYDMANKRRHRRKRDVD